MFTVTAKRDDGALLVEHGMPGAEATIIETMKLMWRCVAAGGHGKSPTLGRVCACGSPALELCIYAHENTSKQILCAIA